MNKIYNVMWTKLVESGRRVAIEFLLKPMDEDDVIRQTEDDNLLFHITEYGVTVLVDVFLGRIKTQRRQICTIHY